MLQFYWLDHGTWTIDRFSYRQFRSLSGFACRVFLQPDTNSFRKNWKGAIEDREMFLIKVAKSCWDNSGEIVSGFFLMFWKTSEFFCHNVYIDIFVKFFEVFV